MRNLKAYRAGMLAVAAVGLTAACNETRETGTVTSRSGGETSSAPAAEAVEERDNALIRVVNAIPGQTAVTIYAGDSAAFKDVGYKKATGYEEIPDDRFNFQIKSGDAPKGEALASNRENLQDGGHYTIVALPSEDPTIRTSGSSTTISSRSLTARRGSASSTEWPATPMSTFSCKGRKIRCSTA